MSIKKEKKDNFKQKRCFACITLDNKVIKTVLNSPLVLWYLSVSIRWKLIVIHIYTWYTLTSTHTPPALFPVTVSAVDGLQIGAARIEPVTVLLLNCVDV